MTRARAIALRSLIALGLLSGVPLAWSASPLEENVLFDIQAQPLGNALLDLSKQSSYRITFGPELLTKVAPGRRVAGEMQVGQALDLLLSGTGFSYKLVGDHAIS